MKLEEGMIFKAKEDINIGMLQILYKGEIIKIKNITDTLTLCEVMLSKSAEHMVQADILVLTKCFENMELI